MSKKTFFSSDHHFYHNNIIKYANRPFSSVTEMNEAMIDNHNSVVGKNDDVYFLGDFAFTRYASDVVQILRQLNGHKHFIAGNHDKIMFSDDRIKAQFETFTGAPYKEIYIQDPSVPKGRQHIVLSHYAFRVWNKAHHGSFHCYGHSHGSLPDDPNARSVDVGVDCWDFTPIEYQQLKKVMLKKNWKPIDHHGE